MLTLRQKLDKCIGNVLEHFKNTLSDDIFEYFEHAVDLASEAAGPTSSRWGSPRVQGGLHPSTYKATVRRNGVYTGCSGPRDFNAELYVYSSCSHSSD